MQQVRRFSDLSLFFQEVSAQAKHDFGGSDGSLFYNKWSTNDCSSLWGILSFNMLKSLAPVVRNTVSFLAVQSHIFFSPVHISISLLSTLSNFFWYLVLSPVCVLSSILTNVFVMLRSSSVWLDLSYTSSLHDVLLFNLFRIYYSSSFFTTTTLTLIR